MRYVITYDIAGDRRREDVAALLSGYGPRVQLSVFECGLRTRRGAGSLQGKLRDLIDPLDDQVRGCPLNDRATRGVAVIGARMIEETPRFLDRHMTRYTPCSKSPPGASASALETAGHGPTCDAWGVDGRCEDHLQHGQRNGRQSRRSGGPP